MVDMNKLFDENGWSLHCNLCGKDVFKNPLDYYMLKDDVWAEICDNDYISTHHVLCRDCAERILGRPFQPEDMADVPVNYCYIDNDNRILKILMEKK